MADHNAIRPVDKQSIAGRAAVAEFTAVCGFSPYVMNDDDWFTFISPQGRPEIGLRDGGVRVMATFAPDPEKAHRIADQLIGRMNRARGEDA